MPFCFQFSFVSRTLLGPTDFPSNEIVKRIELSLSCVKGQSVPFPQSSRETLSSDLRPRPLDRNPTEGRHLGSLLRYCIQDWRHPLQNKM